MAMSVIWLILLLLGLLREVLGTGTLFGVAVAQAGLFPLAAMPVGGFILLGQLAACWRGHVNAFKLSVYKEAKREV